MPGLTRALSLQQKLTLLRNAGGAGAGAEEQAKERRVELVKSDSVSPHKGIEILLCFTLSQNRLALSFFYISVINIQHLFSLQEHHQSFNNDEYFLHIELMASVNSYKDNESLNVIKYLRIKFSLIYFLLFSSRFGKHLIRI